MKEDLSSCKSELLLRFRYTLNDQYANLFGLNVHRVTVYVFDDAGKYVGRFSERGDQLTNDYVMHVPLPEGKYSVVVHGGDYTTYSAGELDQQVNVINEALRAGVTDIHDFRVELQHVAGVDHYLYPVSTADDFYAGLATDAVSAPGDPAVTDVDLILDTKKVKVKVTGTDAYDAPLDLYITALNGRYKFDNGIDVNHGIFKYVPVTTVLQPNYMEANLKMMRLVLGQSSMLTIKNHVTGEVLYHEDMMDQIRLIPQYVSQADFDREDEFVFEISIVNHVVISVSINGWKINNVNPDI